jgi:hypothetical protein
MTITKRSSGVSCNTSDYQRSCPVEILFLDTHDSAWKRAPYARFALKAAVWDARPLAWCCSRNFTDFSAFDLSIDPLHVTPVRVCVLAIIYPLVSGKPQPIGLTAPNIQWLMTLSELELTLMGPIKRTESRPWSNEYMKQFKWQSLQGHEFRSQEDDFETLCNFLSQWGAQSLLGGLKGVLLFAGHFMPLPFFTDSISSSFNAMQSLIQRCKALRLSSAHVCKVAVLFENPRRQDFAQTSQLLSWIYIEPFIHEDLKTSCCERDDNSWGLSWLSREGEGASSAAMEKKQFEYSRSSFHLFACFWVECCKIAEMTFVIF